jgi:two-component system response regulator PilR (NtrC family)
MCENGNITAEDLRLTPRSGFGESGEAAPEAGTFGYTPAITPPPRTLTPPPPYAPTSAAPSENREGDLPGDLAAAVAETERAAIMKALEATRWNRTAAAKQLGLTLRQLRYRLEKLGIE